MAIPLYSGRKAQFLEKNGKEGIIREIIKFLRTELRTFSWLKSVTECPEQWITNNLHQYMSWDFMKTRWIKFPKVFMKVKNRFYRKYLPLELYPVLKSNSRGKTVYNAVEMLKENSFQSRILYSFKWSLRCEDRKWNFYTLQVLNKFMFHEHFSGKYQGMCASRKGEGETMNRWDVESWSQCRREAKEVPGWCYREVLDDSGTSGLARGRRQTLSLSPGTKWRW